MSLHAGGLQRSLPKRSHSLANNSFLLDGNFRLDIPPPGGLGTASMEVIGGGGGGSQLPPGMGGMPGIPSGYSGPLEQESYPSSGEEDDDEDEDDEDDDEDDDGEEGDYEDEESGKGSSWISVIGYHQRRYGMRHEMLTQRAPFCIGAMAKKGTLSQHFVTHVVPPLGYHTCGLPTLYPKSEEGSGLIRYVELCTVETFLSNQNTFSALDVTKVECAKVRKDKLL